MMRSVVWPGRIHCLSQTTDFGNLGNDRRPTDAKLTISQFITLSQLKMSNVKPN